MSDSEQPVEAAGEQPLEEPGEVLVSHGPSLTKNRSRVVLGAGVCEAISIRAGASGHRACDLGSCPPAAQPSRSPNLRRKIGA
jgi:hypothetical protein